MQKVKNNGTDDLRSIIQQNGPVYLAETILKMRLSNDQKEFLTYLWQKAENFTCLLAPRASGKTITLALFVLFCLIAYDNFEVHVMGGSLNQAVKEQLYIQSWVRRTEILETFNIKTYLAWNQRKTTSKYGCYAIFTSCTTKSAKSPHPNLLIIDEMAEGESEPVGAEAIEASFGEIIQSNSKCIMSSTADYCGGRFYDYYLNSDKYPDIKLFRWEIVEHTSKNPVENSKDKKAENWSVKPDVHWIDNKKIRQLRKTHDDNWFLTNIIGGLSVGSGNVISAKDLIVQDFNVEELSFVETRMGIDLGFSATRDPTAITVLGLDGTRIYVIFHEEVHMEKMMDLLSLIRRIAQTYRINQIWFDPSASSRPYIDAMQNVGFDCPIVTEYLATKEERVSNLLNLVERRKIMIHADYEATLVKDLRALHYQKGTREVEKLHDHGFDSLCYALCDLSEEYYEVTFQIEPEQETFFDILKKSKSDLKFPDAPKDSFNNELSNVRIVKRKKGEKLDLFKNEDGED